MALIGACSNGQVGVEVSKANALRIKLLGQSRPTLATKVPKRRPQVITSTVLEVLAATSEALRTVDVHRRVEQRLGHPVSWPSIKDALAKQAARPDSRVERIARGRYRRRPPQPD